MRKPFSAGGAIRILPGQSLDRERNIAYNYRRTYDPAIERYLEPGPVSHLAMIKREIEVSRKVVREAGVKAE